MNVMDFDVIPAINAMCTCLPQLFKLVADSAYNSVQDGTGLNGGTSELINLLAKLEVCVLEQNFQISNNGAQVVQHLMDESKGSILLMAAEIDLEMYSKLVGAIVACAFGKCDPGVFTEYLEMSREYMLAQLETALSGWKTVLKSTDESIKAIGLAGEEIITNAQSLPSKIKTIEDQMCKDSACSGPVITAFMDKVDTMLNTITGKTQVGQAAASVTQSVENLITLIEGTVESAGLVEEPDTLAKIVGTFNRIGDVIQTFKIVQQLPKLAESLGQDSQAILEFLQSFGTISGDAIKLVSELLEGDWEGNPLEFTTDSTGKVREGMAQIQDLIRTQVEAPLKEFSSQFSQLKDQISTLPFIGKSLSVTVNVASYQRQTVVSMNMPCAASGQLNFKPCPISVPIQWPNHHIPWIRLG
ncbi:hypothetical protein PV10_08675 [Exophiala mesophila]|uniref:Uncharacterized protein n=1 Tax=Exophiala mesophila TaxID=212818 RepID=A0A0D1Z5A2_EXOME|nr:uncharacterized protein PV10_08675 [Exophiala mesophila]KIV89064.1 hypothetical protein PV10_08675 [Exophiala mesophila]